MNKFESTEDYLERILMLSKKQDVVRSIDIAKSMNFSKPSISIAMKKLKENNLISIDSNGAIYLTKEGAKIANETLSRHTILSKALISLGVPEDIALTDACKIEHDLSKESFDAIKKHFQ